MEAPASQHADGGQLIPNAPPEYDEKQPLCDYRGRVPVHGSPLSQAQYPQVQPGGVLPTQVLASQAGYPMPAIIAAPPPDHPPPPDFLMLALVTAIICGILNLISLAFGIPAIIFAVMSINTRNDKNYRQALQYGRTAFILTVINIIFTLFLALLVTAMIVGAACINPYAYYGGSC